MIKDREPLADADDERTADCDNEELEESTVEIDGFNVGETIPDSDTDDEGVCVKSPD